VVIEDPGFCDRLEDLSEFSCRTGIHVATGMNRSRKGVGGSRSTSPSGVEGATRAYSPPRKDSQQIGLALDDEVDTGVRCRRLRRPMSAPLSAQPAICAARELSSRNRAGWPASSGLRINRPSTAGSGRRTKASAFAQGSNGTVAGSVSKALMQPLIDVADI